MSSRASSPATRAVRATAPGSGGLRAAGAAEEAPLLVLGRAPESPGDGDEDVHKTSLGVPGRRAAIHRRLKSDGAWSCLSATGGMNAGAGAGNAAPQRARASWHRHGKTCDAATLARMTLLQADDGRADGRQPVNPISWLPDRREHMESDAASASASSQARGSRMHHAVTWSTTSLDFSEVFGDHHSPLDGLHSPTGTSVCVSPRLGCVDPAEMGVVIVDVHDDAANPQGDGPLVVMEEHTLDDDDDMFVADSSNNTFPTPDQHAGAQAAAASRRQHIPPSAPARFIAAMYRNARLAKQSFLYASTLPWHGQEAGDIAALSPASRDRAAKNREYMVEDFRSGLLIGVVAGLLTYPYLSCRSTALYKRRPQQTISEFNSCVVAMNVGAATAATVYAGVMALAAFAIVCFVMKHIGLYVALALYGPGLALYGAWLGVLRRENAAGDDVGPEGQVYGVRVLFGRGDPPTPPADVVDIDDVIRVTQALRTTRRRALAAVAFTFLTAAAALFSEGFKMYLSPLFLAMPLVGLVLAWAVRRLWFWRADTYLHLENVSPRLVQKNLAWVLRRSDIGLHCSLWLVRRVPRARDLYLAPCWYDVFASCDVHFQRVVKIVLFANNKFRERGDARYTPPEVVLYTLEYLLTPDLHTEKFIANAKRMKSAYMF